jgi:hypothetical protein
MNLVTLESHRRRGLSKRLMEAIMEHPRWQVGFVLFWLLAMFAAALKTSQQPLPSRFLPCRKS